MGYSDLLTIYIDEDAFVVTYNEVGRPLEPAR